MDRTDLTVAEVAEQLGRGRSTVLRLVTSGDLHPRTKLPGKTGAYLFDRDEVERVADDLAKAGPR